MSSTYEYDFFICHASEDKDTVVRPLARLLVEKGFRVWYDEYELTVGDKLRASIDKGLASSMFGIVVLSPSFFAKEWPQKELDGLDALERDGRKVILPVWHDVDQKYVGKQSPTLAARLATTTSHGIERVADEIAHAHEKDSTHPGPGEDEVPVDKTGSDGLLLLGPVTAHDLEDYVFNECIDKGYEGILRILRKEFHALQRGIVEDRSVSRLVQQNVANLIVADSIGILTHAMRNTLPVRVGLMSAGYAELDPELGEDLYNLYAALFFRRSKGEETLLQMHHAIICTAFAAGAYSILQRKPALAKSLLGRSNPVDSPWEKRSWFKYMGTQLALRKAIGKSILQSVKEFWDEDEYLADLLGAEEAVWKYLCQFDFLQCASILATGREIDNCFASFSVFRRNRVQPIVEKMIDTYLDGVWLPSLSGSHLAQIIVRLEEYGAKWAGFEYAEWDIGKWSSRKIRTFLIKHGHEVR